MAGAGAASDRCRRFTGHHMAATSARRTDIDLGEPDRWSICAGTLDPPTGLRTVRAWWTSEASDYFVRADLPEVDTA